MTDVRISYEHGNVLSLPDVITYALIRNSKQLSEHLSNRRDDQYKQSAVVRSQLSVQWCHAGKYTYRLYRHTPT